MTDRSNNIPAGDVLTSAKHNPDSMTDEQLVAEIQRSGDITCADRLISRYTQQVENTVRHYAYNHVQKPRVRDVILAGCDDITVQVFQKIWLNIHTVDTGQPFGAWVRRVTLNTTIDHLRSCFRRLRKLDDGGGEDTMDMKQADQHSAGHDGGFEFSMETTEMLDYLIGILQQAIEQLESPILRDTMHALCFEQQSYPDIARRLKVSQQCVRSNVSRTIPMLQELFNRLNTKYPPADVQALVQYLAGLRRGRRRRAGATAPTVAPYGGAGLSADVFARFVRMAPGALLNGFSRVRSLGERLSERIRQRGMTYDQAVEALHLSVHDLNDLLNDSPPRTVHSDAVVRRLAGFLDMTQAAVRALLESAVPAEISACVRAAPPSSRLLARLRADAREILGRRGRPHR